MNRFKQRGRYGGACLLLWACLANVASATEPPITAVAFTPDGELVVAVSQAGLHEYSWPELTPKRTLEVSASNLHCLAFSPNGEHLAVGMTMSNLQKFDWVNLPRPIYPLDDVTNWTPWQRCQE